MGKYLRRFFVVAFAILGLILIFNSQTNTTEAATDYQTNDLLSGMSIAQKDYGTASDVNLTLDWKVPANTQLQNGDTWTVDFPDTLKVTKDGERISIYDSDNNVIGTAVLNKSSNSMTVTFNENVENKTDFAGEINIGTGVQPGKDAVVGNNDVTIGNFTDNMTLVSSDADFSKKGVIGKDANGNAIITWTILVNRNSENFPNLTVKDFIDPSSGQTYVDGTVNVYEAYWSSPGYYKKGQLLSNGDYNLQETSGSGFTLNGLSNNQFYAVTFQTKINNPADAENGTKFKNHADFTWGGGTSGETNSGVADGSVTGNSNSGSGNGNEILGSVILTKTSADENNTPLAGAVYDLYQEGSDTPIKSGLTTNGAGQINVGELAKGNYYFKEVTPPTGYTLNTAQIPFTISGTTTDAVHVFTTNEPVKDDEDNNEDNNTEEPNTGEGNDKDDNNEDVIVDPENPSSNNDEEIEGEAGLITNPFKPGQSSSDSDSKASDSNTALPQTGTDSGIITSIIGLFVLTNLIYFKRRNV
ncbi:Ig-like domain-containing protein [Companilactobacillus halodurans]|uniref:LPXTG cell wall anchor domain-containing protein n=1 Tax=Companilactobacillus halodurans TaxID=2584183 RepID=A0A5P0ZZ23_9LACO|nr:Ig-like domain-containing protein [Companilactobacillus halodurans]MQS75794.1 LPXTG cell wall anchor domain-containing protein [Companilactobacillus halodurans]MQS97994.1 LPXTG cell wall anchor domain-containing protein [Companilactobacillus halodurans]